MKLVKPHKRKYSVHLTNELLVIMADFDDEQIEALKDSLTFDNPAYETTRRFSPYARIAVSPLLPYYYSDCGILHVPAGASLKTLNDPMVLDQRVEQYADTVPKFVLDLRRDQQTAQNSFIAANGSNKLCGMIQLPTGKGKTILALSIAARLEMKTLVIVHKDDLVSGWNKDIDLSFDSKCKPGLIKASSRKVGDFITIATVQTLSRMRENKPDEYNALLDQFGLIIVDECHHCPATSYDVINDFQAMYRLGLTATPERKDGLAHVMKLYFGGFCYRYQATEEEDDILPVTVVRRSADFLCINPLCDKDERGRWFIKDLRTDPRSYKLQGSEQFISDIPYNSRPKIVYADYSDLVTRRLTDFVMQDVAREWQAGHSCIVFFSQKQQIDDFKAAMKRSGYFDMDFVFTYYGDNSTKENDRTLQRAEAYRMSVTLATYSKATEGTNCRQWEVAFLVGSLNDAKNTEQAVGRIRRVKEKKLERARVYDYRCPNVYSIASHARTRDARYRKLGFAIVDNPPMLDSEVKKSRRNAKPFSRGYSR